MRERHGLAAASSAQPGLGPPPHSGSYGTVVEARWLRAGTGASAKPGPGPQWIHVNGDRPIRVGFFQGDAQRAAWPRATRPSGCCSTRSWAIGGRRT